MEKQENQEEGRKKQENGKREKQENGKKRENKRIITKRIMRKHEKTKEL